MKWAWRHRPDWLRSWFRWLLALVIVTACFGLVAGYFWLTVKHPGISIGVVLAAIFVVLVYVVREMLETEP